MELSIAIGSYINNSVTLLGVCTLLTVVYSLVEKSFICRMFQYTSVEVYNNKNISVLLLLMRTADNLIFS